MASDSSKRYMDRFKVNRSSRGAYRMPQVPKALKFTGHLYKEPVIANVVVRSAVCVNKDVTEYGPVEYVADDIWFFIIAEASSVVGDRRDIVLLSNGTNYLIPLFDNLNHDRGAIAAGGLSSKYALLSGAAACDELSISDRTLIRAAIDLFLQSL